MALHNNFEPIRDQIRSQFEGPDNMHWEIFRGYKKSVNNKEFCKTNKCEFLVEALDECYNLRYDQKPDYVKLKFILQKVLLDDDQLPGG